MFKTVTGNRKEIELVGNARIQCHQSEKMMPTAGNGGTFASTYKKHAVRFQWHYGTCAVKLIGEDDYHNSDDRDIYEYGVR